MKILMTRLFTLVAFTTLTASAFAQGEESAPAPAPEQEATSVPAAAPEPAAAPKTADVATPTADAEGRFVIGLRLGYALPMGDAIKGGPVSDYVSGVLPIWLDLGYMVTRNIMVGLYGQYGFGFTKSKFKDSFGVPSAASTSASDIRFGAQAQYHLMPGQSMNPWFGLGFGYELGSVTASLSGHEMTVSARGFEYVNFQGGLDFRVTSFLGIGPFLSLSLGEFDSYKISQTGSRDQSGDISQTAMHEWLTFGVCSTLKL
jgi:outer membrane protein